MSRLKKKSPVLMRITTVPLSMQVLLKGQPSFMHQHGFRVVMVSNDGPERRALMKQESCPHFIMPLTRKISPFTDLQCLIKLFFLIRKLKPAIVHTHTPKAGLIGMWAAYFAGVPIRLHTIAGLPWMETSGAMRWLLKTIEKLTFFPATKVFPNSFKQMDFLKANGLSKQKMEVLGNGSSNGIDTHYFSKTEDILNEAKRLCINAGVKETGWVWIFVGRVVNDKGIAELLKSFNEIHRHYPQDQLWILGNQEPDLDPLSEEALHMLNHHDAIKQWGFVHDVRAHLAAAKVLVFPSYREGFPNVPLQAGAMECALILSDINGCNEIVEDKKNGWLVPVKNTEALSHTMKWARENEEETMRLAKTVRGSIVEKYDRKKMWHILLEKYCFYLKEKGIV